MIGGQCVPAQAARFAARLHLEIGIRRGQHISAVGATSLATSDKKDSFKLIELYSVLPRH